MKIKFPDALNQHRIESGTEFTLLKGFEIDNYGDWTCPV